MPSGNRPIRRALSATLICLVALLSVAQPVLAASPAAQSSARGAGARSSTRMSYGQLLTAIDRGQVKAAAISEDTGEVNVTLASGAKFKVTAPADDTTLAPRLHRAGADVSYTTEQATSGKAAPVWMMARRSLGTLVPNFRLTDSIETMPCRARTPTWRWPW